MKVSQNKRLPNGSLLIDLLDLRLLAQSAPCPQNTLFQQIGTNKASSCAYESEQDGFDYIPSLNTGEDAQKRPANSTKQSAVMFAMVIHFPQQFD